MRRALLVLVGGLALAGCVTSRFADACRDEVNHCMDACPEPTPTYRQNTPAGVLLDSRQSCEQICYERGRTCSRAEAERAREEQARQAAGL